MDIAMSEKIPATAILPKPLAHRTEALTIPIPTDASDASTLIVTKRQLSIGMAYLPDVDEYVLSTRDIDGKVRDMKLSRGPFPKAIWLEMNRLAAELGLCRYVGDGH
jgi:hypothetical protein